MMDRSTFASTAAVVVALAVLVSTPQKAEAAFLSSNDWLAALSSQPSQMLATFPSYSLVTEDAFAITGPVQVNTTGQWAGFFGCNSAVNPCLGAYRAAYTLPFEIIGYRGDLFYDFSDSSSGPPAIIGLDVSDALGANPPTYTGFYGDFFAPTNTLLLSWPPGFVSTDDQTRFLLSSAQVVLAPVPEPSSLILLGGGLLVWAGSFRQAARAMRGPALDIC